jgi:hypothetical protein
MMSIKLFQGKQQFLRFEGDGVCVTIDMIPSKESIQFLGFLDKLTYETNGIPHLIKDSRIPLSAVKNCYAEYSMFKESLNKYDSSRLFQSELSNRLEL